MSFLGFLGPRWPQLLFDSYQHASAVVQCTIVAAVLGVLIGIAVYRCPGGSAIATALTSAILTIPSFAMLGLLIPLLGLGVRPTVAAFAKGPGLGNMIFSGLAAIGSANAVNRALAGTIGVVVIALVLDFPYFALGRLSTPRSIRG